MYSARSPHQKSRTTFEFLFAAFLQTSRPTVGPPSLPCNRYWFYFPWVQRSGNEVNHSPVSSAEVKNQWSYTSTQPVRFLGVDREDLTSTSHLSAAPQRWGVTLFPWTVRGIVRCGGLTTRFHGYFTVSMADFDIHLATLCVLSPMSPSAACQNRQARRQAGHGPLLPCHA
jgi:hypothetical protein